MTPLNRQVREKQFRNQFIVPVAILLRQKILSKQDVVIKKSRTFALWLWFFVLIFWGIPGLVNTHEESPGKGTSNRKIDLERWHDITSMDSSANMFETDDKFPEGLPQKGPFLSRVTQNSIVVSWHTATLDSSLVQFGLSLAYENEVKDTTLKTAHSSTIIDLLPNSIYHYRILFEGKQTPDYTFRTAVSFDTTFRFVVYGDSRTQADSHLAVISRIMALDPYFVLHTGDLVANGFDQTQWAVYFATICSSASCAQKIPFYYAIGNHENESPLYYSYFHLPHNNPDSSESYYSFDYGNSHFISLDTQIPFEISSPQYQWLISDLRNSYYQDFLFVFMHDHPYCAGGHNSNLILRNTLSPIFEAYKVDLVFSGHSHFYQRNGPINGVTYLIAAGGGAPLYTPAESSWTKYSEGSHHCVKFTVRADSLRLEMVRTDGTIKDSLILQAQQKLPVKAGDLNHDEQIDIGDVVFLINCLYKNGPAPVPFWIGDCDLDGLADIDDIVYLINYLFMSGPPPSC